MVGNVSSKSRTRAVVSAIFIVGFFAWLAVFFSYTFSIDTQTFLGKLTIWFGIIIAGLLIFLGIAVGAGADAKTMTAGSIVFVVWSLGLLVIPVPEGYGEAVLGSYSILLMVMVALFFEYKKIRKRSKTRGYEN